MLTLHLYHMSPYNEKLLRMSRHKGLDFQERYWRVGDRGKVRKHNPTGKLPAIEHDGRWICDSSDAARYLEEQFPERPLLPADPAGRALAHVLEDWADESLYFYEMHMRFTTEGNWQRNLPRMFEHEGWFLKSFLAARLPGMIRKGIQDITATQGIGRKSSEQLLVDCERHIGAVSDLLGDGEWLVGDAMSLADLSVFGMFAAFRDADMLAEMLGRYPAVTGWMQRIEAATDP